MANSKYKTKPCLVLEVPDIILGSIMPYHLFLKFCSLRITGGFKHR